MKALKWFACAAAVACSVGISSKAKAEVQIAGDFDIAVPLAKQQTIQTTLGYGFDGRLGYRFRIPRTWIYITPEIAGGYTAMDTNIIRVRPGLRLGFGRVIQPYLFGHIGWSWTAFDDPCATNAQLKCYDRALTEGGKEPARQKGQGAAFDVGLGLDFRLHRFVTIGAHATYNVVNVSYPSDITIQNANIIDKPKWFGFGVNATLYF